MDYNDLFMNQDLSSAEKVSCYVVRVANAFQDLLARAEAAEARVRELETSFRTEKCENGPECVELGKVRKALSAAEARAEKAERERDAAISDLTYIARTYPVDLCDDLVCQYHNNPVTRYIADAVAEKLTREAAEAALKGDQHEQNL